LDARGRTKVTVQGVTVPLERVSIDDTQLGLGDVILKTKYAVGPALGVDVAPGVTLRIPTGDTANFHGLGNFIVTPRLLLSREIGPHAVHADLGCGADPDDLAASTARYGVGVSLRALEGVSILAELIGKSAFVEDEVRDVRFGGFSKSLPRTDIVDAAVGVKARLLRSGVGFVSVVVPVTSDGIRADAVPVGGIEVTF